MSSSSEDESIGSEGEYDDEIEQQDD